MGADDEQRRGGGVSDCNCDPSSNFGLIVGSLILGILIYKGLVHMGHDISGWTEENQAPTPHTSTDDP